MNPDRTRALCLWPGLAGIWLRGQWSSLVLAAGFSLLLNLALAGSFIWPELLGPRFSLVVWPILAIGWTLSFGISWKMLDRRGETAGFSGATDDTLFIQAQTEYLKGDWELCHRLLVQQLTDQPRDLESRLLLASTLRRLHRRDAARQQLVMLQRIDGWQTWQPEIHRELARLDQEHPAGNLLESRQTEAGEPGAQVSGGARTATILKTKHRHQPPDSCDWARG